MGLLTIYDEFIDPDLFYDKKIIWVESLVEKFRGVYYKDRWLTH